MTRQLSHLFPHCHLDVVKNEKDEYCLEIKKGEYLLSKENLFSKKDRNSFIFMDIPLKNFNLARKNTLEEGKLSYTQMNNELTHCILSPIERSTYVWLKKIYFQSRSQISVQIEDGVVQFSHQVKAR